MSFESLKPIETTKFSDWYLDTCQKAGLFDYSPVRGCMVIKPYGYAIWELISREVDDQIKKRGVQNAYFPVFIPESFISKEKKHVEGFSPELAVVTHAGGELLAEPLVVRPTSETIIYHMFEKWIKSYRDLPLKINQWANVVRWEMRTRPFLRTTEFLWQEGHTAHADEAEATDFTKQILDMYVDLANNFLAMPVLAGNKTETERFAGAKITMSIEAMMGDGKALQLGTSHLLEHSFPEAFGVKFQDKDGNLKSPWCTSWAVTTRLIGAIIMVHGDEKGLALPPKIAPIQVAIVPIKKSGTDTTALDAYVSKIMTALKGAGIRHKLFDDGSTPGQRYHETEMLGIPLRIEVGLRDAEQNSFMVAARKFDPQFGVEKKFTVNFDDTTAENMKAALDKIQKLMYLQAEKFLHVNIFTASCLEELKKGFEQNPGFYEVFYCNGSTCEQALKAIQGTFRVIRGSGEGSNCFGCGHAAKVKVIAAKAY